tara:strand:+ start:307 stop:531 length:225 start_codon:yes stop_codon:yes gene_type:complete
VHHQSQYWEHPHRDHNSLSEQNQNNTGFEIRESILNIEPLDVQDHENSANELKYQRVANKTLHLFSVEERNEYP